MRETDKYVLFWRGELSNWYHCSFEYKGIKFTCSEQAMMWEKAMMFSDTEIAAKILETDDPQEQKKLCRMVAGFNSSVWNRFAKLFVTNICYAKFSQNPELKELILSFGNKKFVEASEYDKIWGIGLAEDNPLADDESTWQGTNWLGICLSNVRDILRSDNIIILGEDD